MESLFVTSETFAAVQFGAQRAVVVSELDLDVGECVELVEHVAVTGAILDRMVVRVTHVDHSSLSGAMVVSVDRNEARQVA